MVFKLFIARANCCLLVVCKFLFVCCRQFYDAVEDSDRLLASIRDLLGVDPKVCWTVSTDMILGSISIHCLQLRIDCVVHDWLVLSDAVSSAVEKQTVSQCSTLVRSCCKGDVRWEWTRPIFGLLPPRMVVWIQW